MLMETAWVWLQFAALAAVIGFAGYHLSDFADQISERTGLGRNWIGLILLATITSLPELMAGYSAVNVADKPDLAVGDVLGSCVFNLALVVVLDVLHRESSVYSKATQGHLLSGALGIILLSFVGFGITTANRFFSFSLGHVGGFALSIPLFYLVAMRALFLFEKSARGESEAAAPSGTRSNRSIYGFFALAALVVLGAGAALPFTGARIMEQMGWNEAFVGTLFIALATSLPELAVTISAIRLNAVELAFSNLLGSNLFNIVILTFDDIFYAKGPLFQAISPVHSVTAFTGVMMTGLVMVALIQTPRTRLLGTVSGMSVLLFAAYLINAYVMFMIGT